MISMELMKNISTQLSFIGTLDNINNSTDHFSPNECTTFNISSFKNYGVQYLLMNYRNFAIELESQLNRVAQREIIQRMTSI